MDLTRDGDMAADGWGHTGGSSTICAEGVWGSGGARHAASLCWTGAAEGAVEGAAEGAACGRPLHGAREKSSKPPSGAPAIAWQPRPAPTWNATLVELTLPARSATVRITMQSVGPVDGTNDVSMSKLPDGPIVHSLEAPVAVAMVVLVPMIVHSTAHV